MKKILFILSIVTLPLVFTSCSDDDDNGGNTIPADAVELKVDETELQIAQENSRIVNITAGNGDYKVTSSNEEVATATVDGKVITITALPTDNNAEAMIVVTDKYYKRAYIKVETAAVFGIRLNKSEATLFSQVDGQDVFTFKIITGNGGYKVEYLENPDNCTELIGIEDIETTGTFTVKGLDNGTAKIKITDKLNKSLTVVTKVIAPDPLITNYDGKILQFSATQQYGKVEIISGNGGYKLEVADPSIVKASMNGSTIEITGKKNGSTYITITDSKKQENKLTVTVDGKNYGLALDNKFWLYANFGNITDNKLVKVKQTTWEIICRLNSLSWLETFIGMEGKCLLRGTGDGSHIELSALGDAFKFHSKTELKTNEWIHITFVIDCSKTNHKEQYRLFINGEEDDYIIDNQSNRHEEVDLASSNDDNKFTLGRACGDDRRMLNGSIGEARVWTVARTPEQIRANLWKLTEKDPVGLLGHWEFNAGVETNYIQDISGGKFENNLTICGKGGAISTKVPMSAWIEKDYLK
ncbi:LamG-like jellyroll fold domain-containing protein [Bacteroides faecalis]|uniref:LamG-like jellyroll fold domain-containing protein n=1 Tax=Bacteroides faecalis TaxID=2447885 RepID=UPI000F6269E9|nr:LamG-like jellyroll fold domain-containing protein [Bacteroides faecalis]